MVNLLDISKRALRPLQAVDRLESTNREAIIARVRHLSPGLSADDTNISDFLGGGNIGNAFIKKTPIKFGRI